MERKWRLLLRVPGMEKKVHTSVLGLGLGLKGVGMAKKTETAIFLKTTQGLLSFPANDSQQATAQTLRSRARVSKLQDAL